jgi:ferric-dicitrate binding protein FerR (iron transport regulator)
VLKWRHAGGKDWHETAMECVDAWNKDHWRGECSFTEVGANEFTIEAWGDFWKSWQHEWHAKFEARQPDLQSETLEGAAFVEEAAKLAAARKVKAQAIGTAFSVRMRDDAVEILVNEGVVEAWSHDAAFRRIRLEAGQRALVGDDAAIKLEPEQASSVDRALAWRSGMIDLDGKTLQQAADEFNRYNDRKIIVADPVIGAAQIDGVFRINDPEGFAIAVRNILGASVNTETAEVIRIQS